MSRHGNQEWRREVICGAAEVDYLVCVISMCSTSGKSSFEDLKIIVAIRESVAITQKEINTRRSQG